MSGMLSSNRDSRGRFAKGNQCARGRSGENAGRRGELQEAILEAVTPEVMQALVQVLIRMASDGNMQAMRMLLTYTLGRGPAASSQERPYKSLAEVGVEELSPEVREELVAMVEEAREEMYERLRGESGEGCARTSLDDEHDRSVTEQVPFNGDGRDEGREAREECEDTPVDGHRQGVAENVPLNGDDGDDGYPQPVSLAGNWRESGEVEVWSVAKLSERERTVVERYGPQALFDWCPQRRAWVRERKCGNEGRRMEDEKL